MKATEVIAGLAESNGSLLPGLWHKSLYVTCGLTACTPGSAPGPTLGNEYGKTLPFLMSDCFLRACVQDYGKLAYMFDQSRDYREKILTLQLGRDHLRYLISFIDLLATCAEVGC